MTESSNRPPLLQMRGITKRFPGVTALDGVSLHLDPGEVLALMGENGAGKSTLMKILGGAQLPDEGEIFIDGQRVVLGSDMTCGGRATARPTSSSRRAARGTGRRSLW